MRKPQRPLLKLALFAAIGICLGLWVLLRLPCIPRTVTGVICPTCGMSRAWLALLQGDLAAAFSYHPMFWCVPLLVVYAWFDGMLFARKSIDSLVLGLMFMGLLVCYLIRLVCFLDGSLAI